MGVLALIAPAVLSGVASQHNVSVTLNYDFTVDNARSATVTTGS